MTVPLSVATVPVLRAMIDYACRKKYTSGVLGVRARPEWSGVEEFSYDDTAVRVVPCESALAVWEAIIARDRNQWLVVLTDREDDDLGAGIRAHLLWNRLRTPDPWEAVRQRFAASALDVSLTAGENHRDVATGLLAVTPASGWPPAPGGVLTADHAMGSVALDRLTFPESVVDLASVLLWTSDPDLAVLVGNLREDAGSAFADAVLEWIADRCGAVAAPIRHLLRTGAGRDTVPLGLVAGVVARAAALQDTERARIGREGLIRLEPHLGRPGVASAVFEVWSAECESMMLGLYSDMTRQRLAEALLRRADELLAAAQAEGVADDSDWLRGGLSRRFAALADALRRAFSGRVDQRADRPDEPWIGAGDLDAIEEAWSQVAAHHLATRDDHRLAPFHGAVRLARFLAASSPIAALDFAVTARMTELTGRHLRHDAWADAAVNDAATGVSDAALSAGLTAVLAAAATRRSAHDAAFGRALARYTAEHSGGSAIPGVWHIEDVLREAVFPVAAKTPVLLLVLDGMAASNAVEIIGSVLERASEGWAEALLPGAQGRAAALAALPTLTEVSRACLLTGRLVRGGQDVERAGYEELCRSHKISTVALAHKAALDTSEPGEALSADLAAAIANTGGASLVTCVLNTIDDALDRSDPGGTDWTDSTVRHLRPLLEHARRAGRVVILTADHGHVIERRRGKQRSYPDISSGRSRAGSPPPADGEVIVTGERVLLPVPGGPAVLAVDERVRFGPLKAGYHGGASPAEVIVPLAVLVDGSPPAGSGLGLAPPQEPAWWMDPVLRRSLPVRGDLAGPAVIRTTIADSRLRSAPGSTSTLFDEPEPVPRPGPVGSGARDLARQVTASAAYAAQRKISGRLSVSDDKVADLLAALFDAPDFRLSPAQSALALAVPQVALRGAILHVQRLLNIEGYPVLRIDADGATVILDETLLREQFGIWS
jgi:PglZ domain